MSGSKQHFIPRHFLKPFVIPDGNDKLWMCRRGLKKPVPVDRLDAAAQRHFYSKQSENGHKTLDDLITEYEKKIGRFVDHVRLLELGTDIPSYEIAEIVVHFSLRSAHTRGIVQEGLKSIGNTISAVLADPFSFFGKQVFPAHKPLRKVQDLLEKALESEGYPEQTGVSSSTLSRIAYIVLREQSEQIIGGVDKSLAGVLDHFLGETSHAASFVHRNLLSKTLAPEKRVDDFSQLNWRVVAHDSARAILPDCVCFGVEKSGLLKPLFALDIDEIQYAILPLTPSTLAIGSKDESFEYDTETYNNHAKQMSFDFFLTGELQEADGHDLENLGGKIRTDLRKFLDTEMSSALANYSSDDEEDELQNVIVDESEQNFDLGFHISFKGGFDADSATVLAEELNLLLCDFLSPSVIDHLDGFTFALDYEVALNELDRGIEGAGELKSENSERGTGVAMPITVLRNGELKTHIVARDFLIVWLASDDESEKSYAIEAFKHVLSATAWSCLLKTRFPDQMLQPIADSLENFLYGYSANVFSEYFISKNIANTDKSLDELQVTLCDSIDAAFDEVITARRAYRTNNELDALVGISTAHAARLMIDFAKLFAHSEVDGAHQLMSEELSHILDKNQMMNWAKQFQKDLEQFFDELENWSKFERLFFINRHLERWLIAFGIIVENQEDGQIYIHVPLGFDADYLTALLDEC